MEVTLMVIEGIPMLIEVTPILIEEEGITNKITKSKELKDALKE